MKKIPESAAKAIVLMSGSVIFGALFSWLVLVVTTNEFFTITICLPVFLIFSYWIGYKWNNHWKVLRKYFFYE